MEIFTEKSFIRTSIQTLRHTFLTLASKLPIIGDRAQEVLRVDAITGIKKSMDEIRMVIRDHKTIKNRPEVPISLAFLTEPGTDREVMITTTNINDSFSLRFEEIQIIWDRKKSVTLVEKWGDEVFETSIDVLPDELIQHLLKIVNEIRFSNGFETFLKNETPIELMFRTTAEAVFNLARKIKNNEIDDSQKVDELSSFYDLEKNYSKWLHITNGHGKRVPWESVFKINDVNTYVCVFDVIDIGDEQRAMLGVYKLNGNDDNPHYLFLTIKDGLITELNTSFFTLGKLQSLESMKRLRLYDRFFEAISQNPTSPDLFIVFPPLT